MWTGFVQDAGLLGGQTPEALGHRPGYYNMPARSGAHSVYLQGADLVVEWYDFGDHAPYESANLLIFDPVDQAELEDQLGLDPRPSADDLARTLAQRFASYFDVRSFADGRQIAYRQEVDFDP